MMQIEQIQTNVQTDMSNQTSPVRVATPTGGGFINILAKRDPLHFLLHLNPIFSFRGEHSKIKSPDLAIEDFSTFFKEFINRFKDITDQDEMASEIEHRYLKRFYHAHGITDTDYEIKTKIKALFVTVFIQRKFELLEQADIRENAYFDSMKQNMINMLAKYFPPVAVSIQDPPPPLPDKFILGDDDETSSLTRFYTAILEAQLWQTHAKWEKLAFFVASMSTGEGIWYCPGGAAKADTVRRKHLFKIMEMVENKYQKIPKKRKLASHHAGDRSRRSKSSSHVTTVATANPPPIPLLSSLTAIPPMYNDSARVGGITSPPPPVPFAIAYESRELASSPFLLQPMVSNRAQPIRGSLLPSIAYPVATPLVTNRFSPLVSLLPISQVPVQQFSEKYQPRVYEENYPIDDQDLNDIYDISCERPYSSSFHHPLALLAEAAFQGIDPSEFADLHDSCQPTTSTFIHSQYADMMERIAYQMQQERNQLIHSGPTVPHNFITPQKVHYVPNNAKVAIEYSDKLESST